MKKILKRYENCIVCGSPLKPDIRITYYCQTCRPLVKQAQMACRTTLHRAIRRKVLPKADQLWCKDCGMQATVYDHRDYDKPLQVEPLCHRCNARRGPAKVTSLEWI